MCSQLLISTRVAGGHRDKLAKPSVFNACVARPVKPAELKVNQKARDAMQDEWDRLRRVERPDGTHGVWDEGLVEEWSDVRRRAKREGRKSGTHLVDEAACEMHSFPSSSFRRPKH